MYKRILIFLLFFATQTLFCQTDSGDLQVYLNNYLSTLPGDSGNNYTEPSSQEMTDWEACILALIANNLATARTEAAKINYQIIEYTHVGSPGFVSYILEEKLPASKHWGTYVFNANMSTKLVIQAPHAIYDFNTGKQAIYSYINYREGFLFLNGTHRCNHNQASTCSGTTSVCSGSSEAFRISDLAHSVASAWQKATELVYNAYPLASFVQLHGFTKLPTDPYVILSNGTHITPSGDDLALALETALFNEDNSLTFKVAHRDNWTRLVGFTNTQGRLINNSANPCSSSATSTSGRFVHIEQEKTKLRDDESGWLKMSNALFQVFNTVFSTDDPAKINMLSKNPFSETIEFTANNAEHISIYSILGKRMYRNDNTEHKQTFTIETRQFEKGIYLLKVKTANGVVVKKLICE